MAKALQKIKAVFLDALEADTVAERVAFLDMTCGEDLQLRQQVEALFRAHVRPDPLLDRPAIEQFEAELDAATASDDPLDFLAPSQKPGSLGRLGINEVLEVVGQGGMGVVFRAFDEKLQRVVAIKALAPGLAAITSARQRFICEARAAGALTADNVITIHAVEDAGPVPYMVMQYIDGGSLQEKLDRTGALPLHETLHIGWQVAAGLAAAHERGLVHRDVKPANILMGTSARGVKLTDFGLARARDDASPTQTGFVAGTPMYMSPEQARGLPIDCGSDLFSLGSVLYSMCTGQPPFRGLTTAAVLKQVCEQPARPVRELNPELPSWLDDLILRLHAKCALDRVASAREVADLLASRLAELSATNRTAVIPLSMAHEQSRSRFTRPRMRRSSVMVATVLLSIFAGLGMSEATGVTEFGRTVGRKASSDGTLMLDFDDPGISVEFDEAEIVIAEIGDQGIHLKPGHYRFATGQDGKLVRQELDTVTKDGQSVGRLRQDAFSTIPIVCDESPDSSHRASEESPGRRSS